MELQSPGWEVFREVDSGLLKCKGRILSYQPIYLEEGEFVDKLIMHTHNEIDYFGIANTMAALRENWWILRPHSKVKRIINGCNVRRIELNLTVVQQLPSYLSSELKVEHPLKRQVLTTQGL